MSPRTGHGAGTRDRQRRCAATPERERGVPGWTVSDLYFDVMTRLGEMADYETVEAETKQVAGIQVRVATPAALYRLKRGTVRPLDRQDAEALRRQFDLKE